MTSFTSSAYDKSIWWLTTLKQAREYLEACLEGHTRCRSHNKPATRLPTRVIDVGSIDGSKDPFLYVSNERRSVVAEAEIGRESGNQAQETSVPQHIRISPRLEVDATFKYTTLSYCWGEAQNFILKIENLESLKERLPWNELPLTIQDAITLTRGLGIRYIWIDALCIIQDSREDWEAESVKMAEIYGGSFLTIAAALGPNVHYGLMKRGLGQEWNSTVNRAEKIVKEMFPLQRDPLYSRAWALQERMLSPRVLIFGSEDTYCECYDLRRGSKVISYRLPDNPSPWDWHVIIQDYTCRNLTNEQHKLPAIVGLAAIYSQATGKDYICGLWKQTLIVDLLWRQQRLLAGNSAILDPPKEYRAPSWSWASLNGNCMLRYRLGKNKDFKPRTEILATFKDSDSPQEKPVEGDEWILLHGPLLRAKIEGGKLKFLHASAGEKGTCNPWMDLRDLEDLEGKPSTMEGKETWNATVSRDDTWCLLLGSLGAEGYGLVLVEAVDFGEGNYRRVGTFIAYGWEDSFDSCGESDLFLI
ncbi:uncharacterized protein PAC_08626 [Phialocephala subalpina]|uniref:Heterokaryon incompatibility domain-containing protein n=1 Tax=Phialocephala subalpina TaxID=576137 RepID=A0A1L7X137_9HELO|nr:uncharacterized protein PAC_08626 [Phialocephala subalpina]